MPGRIRARMPAGRTEAGRGSRAVMAVSLDRRAPLFYAGRVEKGRPVWFSPALPSAVRAAVLSDAVSSLNLARLCPATSRPRNSALANRGDVDHDGDHAATDFSHHPRRCRSRPFEAFLRRRLRLETRVRDAGDRFLPDERPDARPLADVGPGGRHADRKSTRL